MKTAFAALVIRSTATVLLIMAVFAGFAPAARAGLSLELNLIRYDPNGYYFSPNLNTNNTPANIPFGDYQIASPQAPTNGSYAQYHFDTNGFHQTGGISWGYSDFPSVMQQLTNGTWSIFVTNSVETNVYHFNVTANIDSNSLPVVTITFPANGALNVTNQPDYTWQGPSDYSNLVVYGFNFGYVLDPAQTDFPSPNVLYEGLNNFTVHYDNYPTGAIVASVPLDNLSHPISSWVSTAHLQDYISSQFSVGTPDTSGTAHTLVAHYPFDATSGPVLDAGTDTSGNGYDMSIAGGFGSQGGVDLTSDSEAGIGAVQIHDGDTASAGYLGWSEPPPPALLSTLAGSFTISCWIKTTQNYFGWDSAPAYYGAGIISSDVGGQANDVIPIALTGNKIGFNTGGDFEDVTLNSTASVNDGNYHHIVVTRNQQTGQKLIYIDGVLDSFGSGTTNLLSDAQKLTIGALADAGNPDPNDGSYYNGYDGELDDVQIYSGVLSAGEVANLFATPGSTVANGGGSVGGHTNVAHYTFDTTSTNTFDLGLDSSPQGNNLSGYTYWGQVHTNSTEAIAGAGAVQFFGASDMDAIYQPLTNLNEVLAGSFTFSAWVKTTASRGNDTDNAYFGATIFWAYDVNGNTNDTIPLAITGGKAAFTTRGGDPGVSDTLHSLTSVNDGNYHLITVTRNQASGEKRIYVDGHFEASQIGTSNPLNGNNYQITVGGTVYSSYTGLLDDLQIYTGVLSDAEVASLYANPGTTVPDVAGGTGGPVVHYDFDEGTVLAADVSGNNNNMVHAGNFGGSGPATSGDAKAGPGSVSFDGGSYLTAPSSLLATLAGDFTVSLWLKTSQSFGSPGDVGWQGAGVIAADSPNYGAKDLIPVALTGGQVAFNVGDGNSDNTLNSSGTVNDDNWHHVVVTRNQSTGERQIYIDGTLDSADVVTTELLDSPVLLTIGCKSDASNPDPASPDYTGSNGYEGLLDDLQIYNRVLSSGEVAFLYHNPGAVVATGGFAAALNTSNLTWTTGGDLPWFTETAVSRDGLAAQSGPITDSQSSYLETTVPANGYISFSWKVSSEDGYDYLTFYTNGVQADAISGDVDWNQETYSVSAGEVLRWEYSKDGSVSIGQDAGWLDQVIFTPPDTTPVSVDLTLDIYRQQDPTFGDIFYAFPDINSITPAATGTTTNTVESPFGKFHGEANAGGGNTYSYILSSYSDFMNELTNGLWTLYINKGMPNERQFHFSATVTGLTTNLLSAVKIIAPANGATGVAPNTPFLWLGPTNFSSLYVSKQNADGSGYAGASLDVNATNWPSPPVLAAGTNRFNISYASNNFPGITFSVPVDNAASAISNWTTQFVLNSAATSVFVVSSGASPVQLLDMGQAGNGFQFSFASQSGFTHAVQYRTNLIEGSDWQTYSNVTGDGTLKTIPMPISVFNSSPQGFIRVSTQ